MAFHRRQRCGVAGQPRVPARPIDEAACLQHRQQRRGLIGGAFGVDSVGRLLKDEDLCGDPATRLAAAWRVIVPGIAARVRLEQFEQFVECRRAGVTKRPGTKQSFGLFRP